MVRPFALDSAVVGVLANPSGECAPQLVIVEAWARQHGLEMRDLGTTDAPRELDEGCAFIVALGGDGTILRALQLAMTSHSPVLGVNFGHLGFLADIEGSAHGRPGPDLARRGAGRRADRPGGDGADRRV